MYVTRVRDKADRGRMVGRLGSGRIMREDVARYSSARQNRLFFDITLTWNLIFALALIS
jgi:hypothetical protein